MSIRPLALGIGLLAGGALVWSIGRLSREPVCEQTRRIDAMLGGGLPVCLGGSEEQFEQFAKRARRDAATNDRFFDALELHFSYEVSQPGRSLFRKQKGIVRAACVQVGPGYPTHVDTMAAFRRSVSGTTWTRSDTVRAGEEVTIWQGGNGLRQTVTRSGLFCVNSSVIAK